MPNFDQNCIVQEGQPGYHMDLGQVSLFMEFSRQEYWTEFSFPSPGNIPDPKIEPESLVSCIGRWVI